MEEKELLQKLVEESNSFSEILRKLGKAVSGASIKLLKNKLEEYGIKTLFISESLYSKQPKALSEILVENSNYKAQDLKRRLIKEGLKKDICEVCGQSAEWNGKPLVLQLDHINGDHYDNRLENLRVVCPNCHTQTETFGTRKSTKKCPDCGAEISRKSTYCRKCASRHREEKKRLKQTRE